MSARTEIAAWRPAVPGIAEVLHARFTDHAYPLHTHDTWTLLVVDDGAVRYDLGRHEHGALTATVTLLPPHVPHNGTAATPLGFRKRVLYLEPTLLAKRLIGQAVDTPTLADPRIRQQVHRLHTALTQPGDELEAESRLVLVADRLAGHLRSGAVPDPPPARGLAGDLRDLLDDHVVTGMTLHEAARRLHTRPTHLVRTFGRRFGISPHRYLVGRRVDLARRLLLAGLSPCDVAAAAGFYDQAHLTRHFRRLLGTTPARYARSSPATVDPATWVNGQPVTAGPG